MHTYDVIIIGAGAAGLMTAITSRQKPLKVLLLEGQPKVGAKILMSGGTRCNVTNKTIDIKDYNSEQLMRVRNILRAFDNEAAIKFFEGIGVELVLEPTGKYFPTTHSGHSIAKTSDPHCSGNGGKTVLDALLRQIQEVGVELRTNQKVKALTFKDGLYTVIGEDFRYQAKCIVLTTGGLSYPSTGSDGIGYQIAQSFGHHVIDTVPALTPLATTDEDWKGLSGISLNVRLSLFVDGKKDIFYEGGFLFAHFGFSGPTALDISRHWLKSEGEPSSGRDRREIFINFIPKYNSVTFEDHLVEVQQKSPRKVIKSVLIDFFPERLVQVMLKKSFIEANTAMNQISKTQRRQLVTACVHYPLEVSGVVGYSKAEVTAGGVDLAEVNAKTLESVLQPNLFFAGEILDVDGRIGGFNFQWAWASGYVVGTAVASRN